ncbi:MAG: glycosyltransferase [Campylobacterota bacterium]|nr:glycosyltransferase [Campylobacterota bacterium]
MHISVVIPTFNRENFILEALQSVLNQSYQASEIIIIDDGSSDTTRELLKHYDIHYVYQENKGVSSARNLGIKHAKNDWIAFLDSDDIWESNKLELQVQYHQNNPTIKISHTDEKWIRNGKIINKKFHQKKPQGWCMKENLESCKIGPSTVMMHKSIFDTVGVFDEKLIVCEDYDLWLRVLQQFELGLIPLPLIQKIAGDYPQLSFDTFAMDRFRITALEKHLNTVFKDDVIQNIIQKLHYLVNGAKKRDNHNILKQYAPKLNYYQNLNL